MKILVGERTLQFTNEGLKRLCEKKGKPIFYYRPKIDEYGFFTDFFTKINEDLYKSGFMVDDKPLKIYLGEIVLNVDYYATIYGGENDVNEYIYDYFVSSEERCDQDLISIWEEFGDSIFDSGKIEVVEIDDTKKFKIAFDYDTNKELVLIVDDTDLRIYEPVKIVEDERKCC